MLKSFFIKLKSNIIFRSAKQLSAIERKKVLLVAVLQILMGGLDLLAVALVGIIGALSVTGVQSTKPGNRIGGLLKDLHLDGFSFQQQAAILGLCAAILFVLRTIFSVFFTRKILYFFSRKSAQLSTLAVSRMLEQPLLKIQEKTTQEITYAVTYGVDAITIVILGTTISIVSDVSLLLVMSIGLFLIDPSIAFSSFILFAGIGLLLYRFMHKRAQILGTQFSNLQIQSNSKIQEVLHSYREAVVRNRRSYYSQAISEKRFQLAGVSAEMAFIPNISKYVLEGSVIIGALLITGSQFMLHDASQAVAILAAFMAAGTRIAPAVLRVQQGAIQIKASIGAALPTLILLEELSLKSSKGKYFDSQFTTIHDGFIASVAVDKVSLTYPGKFENALSDVSFKINLGEMIAIVGPSGSGKTSLIDCILGIIKPDSGTVTISGHSPLSAITQWPGAISYVPQDVVIADSTIRENLTLGYASTDVSNLEISNALELAQLTSFVNSLPLGLDTPTGERGTQLSGGQRQRIGIARALLSRPKLLVLDEATSALDGVTENEISSALLAVKGEIAVILISHRLSTVVNADKILYLNKGKVISIGTFNELKESVSDFKTQAGLMGL